MRKYILVQLAVALLLTLPLSAAQGGDIKAVPVASTSAPTEPASAAALRPYEPLTSSLVENAVAAQESRIAKLESELAELRSSSGAYVATTPQAVFDPPPCSSCNRLYGEFELTLLRPRVSGAMPAFGFANGGRVIENNFETGTRYVLGYRNATGLGVRGRYWSYDQDFTFEPPFGPTEMNINAQAADVELTQLQHFGHWDLEASGGLRYAKFGYYSGAAGAFGVGGVDFEGVGPVLALNARRGLGQSGFALFGNVRGSLLFGAIQNRSMLLNMPMGTVHDEVAETIENQMGLAWTHNFATNSQLEIRTAWETQYWMSESLADDVFGIGSNLGFMGPTIGISFRY